MKNLYLCMSTLDGLVDVIDWEVSELNLKEMQENWDTWIVEQVPLELMQEVVNSESERMNTK